MKSYTTYLFDADGTLLDTSELIYQSFLNTCRRFGGFDIERERVYGDVGIPLAAQMQKYLGPLGEGEMEEILAVHRAFQREIYRDTLKLYEGIARGLEELKAQGAVLAIVSSRNSESLDRYLKHTGIYDLFSLIVSPECTENHKPHPEPVLWAMRELGAAPEDTIFTGDALFDIESGNAAGVDTALVSWGHNDPAEIGADPTYILESFEDLIPEK